jgi:hypothetical protein
MSAACAQSAQTRREYSGATLLDVAGAIEALPELALDATHLPMAAGSASAEL